LLDLLQGENAVLSISILTKMNSTKATRVFLKLKGVEDEKELLDIALSLNRLGTRRNGVKIFMNGK
jgi:hypothetical protein